jgi:hypothetical protein
MKFFAPSIAFLLSAICFCCLGWNVLILSRFASQNGMGVVDALKSVSTFGWMWQAIWGMSGLALIAVGSLLLPHDPTEG